MMTDEGTKIESSKDCSTQTFGLDKEFFSFNIPPRLKRVDVRCGTSLVDGLREHVPSPLATTVQGPGLIGHVSSGIDLPTDTSCYPNYTFAHPDHGCYETDSDARSKSFIKQENQDWLGNCQAINNLALIREQTRLDLIPCQQFSQSFNSPPVTIQEMYPGLQKVFLKPVFSYACLIAMALKHSSDNRLPVNEIYNYMQWEFPYFRTAPEGWKNSVRHNLSLNKAFYKVVRTPSRPTSLRPLSITGKGCYWLLDPTKENGMNEEILKWKRKHPEAVRASMSNPANYWNPPNTGLGSPPSHLKNVLVPSRPRYNPYPRTMRPVIPVGGDPESCTISGITSTQQSPVSVRDQSCGSEVSGEGLVGMVPRHCADMVPCNVPVEEKWVSNDGVLFPPHFIG